MKSKDQLHEELEALEGVSGGWAKAVVHALIELGQVTELKCEWDRCPHEPGFSGKNGSDQLALNIDHVHPRFKGGSSRPENLRLLHRSCNTASFNYDHNHWIRADRPEHVRDRIGAGVKRYWLTADEAEKERRREICRKAGQANRGKKLSGKKLEAVKKNLNKGRAKARET